MESQRHYSPKFEEWNIMQPKDKDRKNGGEKIKS